MINFNFFGKEVIIDKALSDRSDLKKQLIKLDFNFSNILFLNQVHGNRVITIDNPQKIFGEQDLPKADGIVTNLKKIALGIVTADCAPIIFYDEENSIIGACHAGWRGAKSGIITNTLEQMQALGAQNIKAHLGPTIQQYSYEVSRDFYDDFLAEDLNYEKFFKKNNKEKWQFNLPAFIVDKLTKNGVYDIDNLEIDTYTNVKNYFSYRRSTQAGEQNSGNNISIICQD